MDGQLIRRETGLEDAYLPGVALFGFKRYATGNNHVLKEQIKNDSTDAHGIIACQAWRMPLPHATSLGTLLLY